MKIGKTYEEQVRQFFSVDIVLGGHGSAMANVFFMRPSSVLIECNPPYFYEMCFANIALISRVHYISVTNYNASGIDITQKQAEHLYDTGKFFLFRRRFAKFNIFPNVFSVVSAVDDALAYVNRKRFGFVINDYWSRVFLV